MTAEPRSPSRWFLVGCGLTCVATLALIAVVWLPTLTPGDGWVFGLVCLLTALMGTGATLAIFTIRRA